MTVPQNLSWVTPEHLLRATDALRAADHGQHLPLHLSRRVLKSKSEYIDSDDDECADPTRSRLVAFHTLRSSHPGAFSDGHRGDEGDPRCGFVRSMEQLYTVDFIYGPWCRIRGSVQAYLGGDGIPLSSAEQLCLHRSPLDAAGCLIAAGRLTQIKLCSSGGVPEALWIVCDAARLTGTLQVACLSATRCQPPEVAHPTVPRGGHCLTQGRGGIGRHTTTMAPTAVVQRAPTPHVVVPATVFLPTGGAASVPPLTQQPPSAPPPMGCDDVSGEIIGASSSPSSKTISAELLLGHTVVRVPPKSDISVLLGSWTFVAVVPIPPPPPDAAPSTTATTATAEPPLSPPSDASAARSNGCGGSGGLNDGHYGLLVPCVVVTMPVGCPSDVELVGRIVVGANPWTDVTREWDQQVTISGDVLMKLSRDAGAAAGISSSSSKRPASVAVILRFAALGIPVGLATTVTLLVHIMPRKPSAVPVTLCGWGLGDAYLLPPDGVPFHGFASRGAEVWREAVVIGGHATSEASRRVAVEAALHRGSASHTEDMTIIAGANGTAGRIVIEACGVVDCVLATSEPVLYTPSSVVRGVDPSKHPKQGGRMVSLRRQEEE